tara:strand:+ start:92 stop:256 length:165 start_codon:yes stop_codon:yes gene_type:complete
MDLGNIMCVHPAKEKPNIHGNRKSRTDCGKITFLEDGIFFMNPEMGRHSRAKRE